MHLIIDQLLRRNLKILLKVGKKMMSIRRPEEIFWSFKIIIIMKIYKIFLFCFLFSFSIQAQVKSGVALYNLELSFTSNENTKQNNPADTSMLARMIKKSESELGEVKGVLKFNSQKSYFTKEVPMGIDNSPALTISLALLGLSSEGYYSSITENERLRVAEKFGKRYLIEDDLLKKKNWDVTKETKKIGKYTAYKATRTKVVENSKGRFESQVIAWFAPEIPYSFGPIGYGGLPGLILQLEINSNFPSKYTIESIDFSEEEIEIKMPEGQRITSDEIDKMAGKAMGNYRNP